MSIRAVAVSAAFSSLVLISQRVPARKVGVPSSVVERTGNSPGEPMIAISLVDTLMKTLWAAGASVPPTQM